MLTFTEAEQRFRLLEDQRRRGVLTPEQYRAELVQLRVTDPWGRLWMLQEQTGQWFVFYEGQWRAAQPPQQAPPPTPPSVAPQPQVYPAPQQLQPAPVQASYQAPAQPRPAQPQPQAEKSGGCGKWLLYCIAWAVIWAIIAVVVYFVADQELMAVAGVGLAAFLSMILMIAMLSSNWQGTITDIRIERERVGEGDGRWRWQNVAYAYVRRSNGKVKRMRAMPDWDIGDRLEKRRGEGQVRHYPHG